MDPVSVICVVLIVVSVCMLTLCLLRTVVIS
jgi:hypothetical protein